VLVRALEAGRDALWDRRRAQAAVADAAAAGTPDRVPARPSNAEALAAVADLALARGQADRSGGERYQVVVHVDTLALAADKEGRCELADGRPVAVETARRLSCDGSMVELQEREGQILSVGRKRRTIPPALRRALAARDRGCRFPGCDRTRFVDGHHIHHWAQGGETSLGNLVSLCRRHHRLVHERGYTVRLEGDGEARFVNQYGVAIANVPRPPPPSGPDALPDRHRRLGLRIDKNTCRNGHGDRMDLGLAVDAIIAIAG
jgi:5-methylcytosine-specific restriction endonuclease McrA